jgi:hypothetical protein
MSCLQNAGQLISSSFITVVKLKYLGAAVTNQNIFEPLSRLSAGNTFYNSF